MCVAMSLVSITQVINQLMLNMFVGLSINQCVYSGCLLNLLTKPCPCPVPQELLSENPWLHDYIGKRDKKSKAARAHCQYNQ